MTQRVNQPLVATAGVMIGHNSAPAVKSDNVEANGGQPVSNMVQLTQAEYDALPQVDANTLYFVTG